MASFTFDDYLREMRLSVEKFDGMDPVTQGVERGRFIEWLKLKNQTRTESFPKSSLPSIGSSCPSSTGSATGSAFDHSPMQHSSRRRLFGQEIKAGNSLKSPPGNILFEQKKDL